MSTRPHEDNVIYANFGAKQRVSSAEETGATTEMAPPRAYSPAAMRVYNAAVRQTDVGRAKRGREYANRGNVIELVPRGAGMRASVAGSQNEPFEVGMLLPTRAPRVIDAAATELVQAPRALDQLKRGNFPDSVLDVLLCESPEEIRFYCDCPDDARVCKHAVALAERAAKLIDATPTVILTMRGLSLVELEERRRFESHELMRENAAPGSEYFWSGRELPNLPEPKVAPMIDDSDIDLLHKAMQSISFTNIDQLRAVADIEDLYDQLTRM